MGKKPWSLGNGLNGPEGILPAGATNVVVTGPLANGGVNVAVTVVSPGANPNPAIAARGRYPCSPL